MYAVIGFMQEAIRNIQPDLLLNLSSPDGGTMHVMSSALNKSYSEYTKLFTKAIHLLPENQREGKFDYVQTNNQIHVLGFIRPIESPQPRGLQNRNIGLTTIITSIAEQVRQSSVKSVMIPYVGSGVSGYNMHEWITLMDSLFGDDVVVYMPTTAKYADNFEQEFVLEYNRPQEDTVGFDQPRKKIIHWQKNMGSINPYNYHPA
jgi:hypothetical protein